MVSTILGNTDFTSVSSGSKSTRTCLKCRSSFTSNWAGERVCPKCKNSQSWKEGSLKRHGAVNPQRGGR